jgi:hypothetical protein
VREDLGAIIDVSTMAGVVEHELRFRHREVGVQVEVIPGEEIKVTVSSDNKEGRTIVVNVDNQTISISHLRRVAVLLNEVELELADDYEDVLNPEDENALEYLVMVGGKGVQVLVSIPSFSEYRLTITTLPSMPTVEIPPLYLVVVAVIALVVVLLAGIWRYVSLGAKKAKLG